jgi:anti-sigma regulatory factor (Ser/Thr protein kinase)
MAIRLRLVLADEAASSRVLRVELGRWLAALNIDWPVAMAAVTAVNEAFLNAISHPVGRRDHDVVVEGDLVERELVVHVRDSGLWADPANGGTGYGYRLMGGLMDHVEIDRRPSGTTVTLRTAV